MAARRDSDSSKPLHRIERDQLQLLTTIRFLAAVEVVMTHVVRGPVLSTLWLGPIIRSGDIAVIFFFALSGFIMTYVYSGSLESEATIDRRRFWSARFVRLAPAYFFALMLGLPDFVYMAFVSHILPLPTFAVGSILVPTFAQAWWPPVAVAWNAPAWSLSVEWAFYGLFPLLLATAARMDRRTLLVSAITAVVAVSVVKGLMNEGPTSVDPQTWGNFLYCFPLFHLPTFVLGMATARIFLFGRPRSLLTHKSMFFGAAAAILILVGARDHLAEMMLSAPVVVPLFCLLIFGGAMPGVCPPFLTSWPFLLLGEASYGLYILHELILAWGERLVSRFDLHLPFWGGVALSVVFTVFLATQFFLHVERPCVGKLRRRLGL